MYVFTVLLRALTTAFIQLHPHYKPPTAEPSDLQTVAILAILAIRLLVPAGIRVAAPSRTSPLAGLSGAPPPPPDPPRKLSPVKPSLGGGKTGVYA